YETDGTDTLTNIHTIRFLDGNTTRIIDDVANVESSTNQVIDFGESVSGQIYRGDKDYYQLQGGEANQAVHVVFSSGSSSYFNTDGLSLNENSEYPNYLGSFTLDASGNQTLYISNSSLSLNDVRSYNYTVMRDLTTATAGADTLNTGTTAEYVDGGAGDDTITGSDRSEYIIGGTGTDIINAGKGDDVILGDDAKDTNNDQSINSKDSEQDDHDVAIFSGKFADYTITNQVDYYGSGDWWSVTGADGTDYVNGIEILRFDNLDYIIDDYDTFEGADAAGRPSYAVMGEQIEGRLTYAYDEDWIAFDFGRNVVNKDTTLKVSWDFVGDASKEFYIVNATGFKLQFTDLSDDTTKQTISFSDSSVASEHLIQGIQWGENAEGGNFGGGQAFLVVDGHGAYDSPGYRYSDPDRNNYTISINRYREGTAGDDVLTTSGATEQERVEEIAGLAGDDTLTGSGYPESFDGGAGDDIINAGGGDDVIKGGAGDDTLSGEAGDDTFVASGTITDTMDGGTGTDTLRLSGDADLSGASFTSVEQLSGRGDTRVSNTGDKLDGFDSTSGVIFSGNSQSLQTLNGNYTLEGTKGNDTLKAGAGDNEIRPLAGTDAIDAGGGDDTVLWATGLTNNWDTQYRPYYLLSSNVDSSTNTYNIQGSYEGGDGSDTLHFRLNQQLYIDSYYDANGDYHSNFWNYEDPSYQYHLNFSDAVISNFEVLKLTTASFTTNGVTGSYGPASITITAQQLAGLSELSGAKVVVKGGGSIDLSSVNLTNGATLTLSGNENFNITGTDADDIVTTYAGNDTIVTGAGDDTVSPGAGVDTISTGAGDDTIIISNTSTVLDSIDAGAGTDTLRVTGNDIDLSSADLSGIEILQANSQSLALTQAQYDLYKDNLTGSADLVLKLTEASTSSVADLPDGFVGIRGSAGNDNLTGSDNDDILVGDAGNDILTGGAGDDRLVGGEGTDTLSGGVGDDSLTDLPGTQGGSIDGGEGFDTFTTNANDPRIDGLTFTSIERITSESGTLRIASDQSLAGIELYNINNIELVDTATFNVGSLPDTWQGTVTGSDGNDVMIGADGDNTLNGGAGVNEAQYQGSEYDYIVNRQADGSVTVAAIAGTPYEADGTDTL
ncbi:MAG: hypothetical protein HOE02_09005, partial [Candidatus Marinimicrobia bacterium]|nr:hypothetical protein [Candidatus Neomarinimicrobiota bacterium]